MKQVIKTINCPQKIPTFISDVGGLIESEVWDEIYCKVDENLRLILGSIKEWATNFR